MTHDPEKGPQAPIGPESDEPQKPEKRSWLRRMFEPGATVGNVFFGMDRGEVHRRGREAEASRLDRQAAKKEKRAVKMSKKIGRGNIRANRAAQTAENLRAAADRKRSGPR